MYIARERVDMMKIPRCMSTQHPDNVRSPFFSDHPEISGEEEIKEAYYVFSHFGVDEQMWDCEGKETDAYVVKKLLTDHKEYFCDNRLGEDLFLTLRVPNPEVEKIEAKVLLETLETIPRSYDTAQQFYVSEGSPIFEVILPMTTSGSSLNKIYEYYRDFVIGKEDKTFSDGTTIKEWIGEFKPEQINVIPLIEDKNSMLNLDDIVGEYLDDKDIEKQRVFLARSDTAMNYGNVSAILLNKLALSEIEELGRKMSVEMYPIIGMGSAPFRGNLKPGNVEEITEGYPSVHTYTVQSSFKYDNPPDVVSEGVGKLKKNETGPPRKVDREKSLDIIERYSKGYRKQVESLADIVNEVARYVPKRRKRKLHVGLFGYSRQMRGVRLPRAITFTASLYSVGVPPELLGMNSLEEKDMEYLSEVYFNFDKDLKDALQYVNTDSPYLPEVLEKTVEEIGMDFEVDREHKAVTDKIIDALGDKEDVTERVVRAADIRGFLG